MFDGPGPADDQQIQDWITGLRLPGLIDLHVHFLPERMLHKVWAYFDDAERHYGMPWPVHYRTPEPERVAALRAMGIRWFAPLVYAHKPDMAEWLTDWVLDFAERHPDAVATGTFYPEPSAAEYVNRALRAGARCFKTHIQVGNYDPRDPLLDPVWATLADAGVPVVVHCGHGPLRGTHTGLDVFAEVLARHPHLMAVLAHAGMPEYERALDLVATHPRVYLDTTMVGVPFTEQTMPLPTDWAQRLVPVADRIVLGTDFPNIPYDYATQLRAIAAWADAEPSLGAPFLRAILHDTPAKLLGLNVTAAETRTS